MITKGIRGAITVDENSAEAIGAATIKLLTEMMNRNKIEIESKTKLTTIGEANNDYSLKIVNDKGKDVTNEFLLGAEKTIDIVKRNNIKLALLKDNSPSCGSTMIYDGSFSQKKIVGMGITAKKLKELGVQIFTENEIETLINM